MRNKKLSMTISSICLALILLATMVGCAQPPQAPEAAPSPAEPTPSPTEPAESAMEPQQWDCTIYMPGMTVFYDIEMQKAFDRIKERTNGLLDVRVVPNGVLPITAGDWVRAVSAGDLEMCLISGGYHAGDYPMWGILDVPYLYSNKFEKRQVWDAARPILQREMEKDNVHLLKYRPAPNQCLATAKPVDVLDLNGLKVRSYSKAISMMIEAMGGTAVTMASSEVNTALERGTIEGVLTTAGSVLTMGWLDPLPYVYDIHFLLGIWVVGVNKDLWDSLPKEVQTIVHEELDQWEGQCLMYAQVIEIPGVFDEMAVSGAKSVEVVDPEFIEIMREKVTKPLLADEVSKSGAVGEEIAQAIEEALGMELL